MNKEHDSALLVVYGSLFEDVDDPLVVGGRYPDVELLQLLDLVLCEFISFQVEAPKLLGSFLFEFEDGLDILDVVVGDLALVYWLKLRVLQELGWLP